MGTSFFQSCSSYNNTIKPANLQALIYAAKVVRAPYQIPSGPDVTAVTLGSDASGAGVTAGTPLALTGSATDTRFNNSNGTQATQAVAGAEAYIDVPPWSAGAVAIALAAADGSFNATTEGLSGTLATGGLTLGKHLVFVRARDTSGQFGPVTAQFLNIVSTTPPAGGETEPNNSIGTANAVAAPATLAATMASSTDSDYFRVDLPTGRTLVSRLTPNTSSDYDLYVYDAAGTQLAKSELGTGAVDQASVTNSTGATVARYVRVKYYSGGTGATNGKYTLQLSW
jgi:hypothetical protein